MPVTINGSTGIAGIDGSAGTPSVQGTDTNTGMFFPAADTIAFAEGGVEAMRIDSSGNVGIGTSSPARRLDIAAPSASAALTSTTGTNAVNFNLNNTGGLLAVGIDNSTGTGFGAGAYGRVIYSGGAYPLAMFTNDTERARIDASGNWYMNSGYGSAAVAYGCRAWVQFDGTVATPSTIRASGNVSSVTKSGTGQYTINLTNALVDANYAVIGTCGTTASGTSGGWVTNGSGTYIANNTTTSFKIQTQYQTGLGANWDYVSVCVIR